MRTNRVVVLFTAILLFLCTSVTGQAPSDYNALSGYMRYWGLLKYTHPAVTEGKMNWDAVFLEHLTRAEQAKNETELTALFNQIMQQCDAVKTPKAATKPKEDAVAFNPISYDIYGVDSALSKKLKLLVDLPKKRQYYLERRWGDGVLTPINDNDTMKTITPEKEIRLLALARFWNFMNYFYPYKNKLPVDWTDILAKYTVKLVECDKTDYYPVMIALTSEIRDTHYRFRTEKPYNRWGNFYAPFSTSIFNDTVVVIWIDPTDSVANRVLKAGDIILEADGVPIDSVVAFYRPYVRKANPTAVNRDLNDYLFRGRTGSLPLTVSRNGVQHRIIIQRNEGYNHLKNYGAYAIIDSALYKVNDTTLYIRPYAVTGKEIDDALKNKAITKIIVDLRMPSKNDTGIFSLLKHVNRNKTAFSTMYYESFHTPGNFRYRTSYNQASKKASTTPYHLVIIVDEVTQSSSEFVCMKFQCIPNSETVGTQTAGALGGVIKIRLPGGISILFTGAGCSYPDGTFIYPNGVKIDHIVNRTVAGIRNGKDELLLKAIQE